MSLISKTAIIKWNARYKEYYISKGYNFTKMGDEFEVRVEDLTKGSHALVKIQCDVCGKILNDQTWFNYTRLIDENNYCCNECLSRQSNNKKKNENEVKYNRSFYQWCYNNLTKYEADIIIKRWDYDLNVDKYGNKLTPKDVSYGSQGFNRKGYWFKCLDCQEHKSEQKQLSSFTNKHKKSVLCNQCNSISNTNPELMVYLVNKEDGIKNSRGSKNKIPMTCPNCGNKKNMSINDLRRQGFGCNKCSDHLSYSEKFLGNFLEQVLDKNFITQLSKSIFKWCRDRRYDFYIDNIKCIVEAHGSQHYEEGFSRTFKNARTLKEERENDKYKENLAIENGIINYIIIDCRFSELEWIKENILNSQLPNLLNFKEEDIDWLKAHEAGCKSLVKIVCDMWNKSNKILDIAREIKVSETTVRRYLKKGSKIGLCEYNPQQEMQKRVNAMTEKQNIKVICLTTEEIFNSIKEAGRKYNIFANSISQCCKGKLKSAGKLPDGTKLIWMYYEEYLYLQNKVK